MRQSGRGAEPACSRQTPLPNQVIPSTRQGPLSARGLPSFIIHQSFFLDSFFLESPCEESDVPYLDDSLHGFFLELAREEPDLLCSDDSLQSFFPETRFLDGSAAGFRLWAVPRLDGSAAGFRLWAVLRPAGAAPRSEESLARPADEAGRREVPALVERASPRSELVLERSDRPVLRVERSSARVGRLLARVGRSSEREGRDFSMAGLVAGAFGLSGHGTTFLVATSPRISVFQHTPCSIGCAAVGRPSDRAECSSVRAGRLSVRVGRSSEQVGRLSDRAERSSV